MAAPEEPFALVHDELLQLSGMTQRNRLLIE
jgi:hypothetical protein